MASESAMDLAQFYPKELKIDDRIQTEQTIKLLMHTVTSECTCPKCGTVSHHKHSTYKRSLQDLPILGKQTILTVNSYEYQCDNPKCKCVTFVENVNGFLNYYSRMTERCADFICTLALETSCEGCACKWRTSTVGAAVINGRDAEQSGRGKSSFIGNRHIEIPTDND